MNHQDHVNLLRPGIVSPEKGAVWADLGAGDGVFTLALAELLTPDATIFMVDRDRRALERGAAEVSRRVPAANLIPLSADFTQPLELPPLDGMVMANSLHFVRRKESLLSGLMTALKPAGHFLLVEYNTDGGNPWVPFPLSFATWVDLALRAGFSDVRLLARVPSRFLGEIYSAVATKTR